MKKYVLLCLCAFVFLACSGVEQKAKLNEKAPEISAKTLQGEATTLNQQSGKIIVLRFWMIGCASCVEAMPLLSKLQERYADKLSIVAINSINSLDEIQKFTANNAFAYPLLKDDIDISAKRYNVRTVPIMFIIDQNGILKEVIHSEVPWKEAEKTIVGYL